MADTKISALTDGAPAVGTDILVVARAGANRRLTIADVLGIGTLDGLSDVVITSPATGAVLIYDGAGWVDGQLDLADADARTGILPTGNGGTGATTLAGAGILVSGGALGTPSSGALTNCTFPTLNQNTSGSAASLSATRNTALRARGLRSISAGVATALEPTRRSVGRACGGISGSPA